MSVINIFKNTLRNLMFCMAGLLFSLPVFAGQSGYPEDMSGMNSISSAGYTRLETVNKQSFTVYVAGPEQARKGLLLIHGWWGLNREMEAWANQFAVTGYRVMAVDLYDQQTTSHPAKARALMNGVKQSVANEKYTAVIKALSAPDRKLAIIGRSYGANQVLHAALVGQEKVSAAIVYYPFEEIDTDIRKLKSIKAPIMGHFAQEDYFFSSDMLYAFSAAIKKSGLKMNVNMYDAGHAFTNPEGKNFNEPAQKLSLHRTHEFLDRHLNQ